MHPDPWSRAGLSCARYAGVARTRWRWKSQPGPSDSFDRAREIVVRGSWSRKWQYCRSRGRLLGRHQWRVWRHGARGSEHEQPGSVRQKRFRATRGRAEGFRATKGFRARDDRFRATREVPRDKRGSVRFRAREGKIRINYDVRAPLCETAFRGSVNGASDSAKERSQACLITK